MTDMDISDRPIGYNPDFLRSVYAKRRDDERRMRELERREELLREREAMLAAKQRHVLAESAALIARRREANDAMAKANDALRKLRAETDKVQVRRVPVKTILRRISLATGIKPYEIMGSSRSRHVVFARQAVMYWAVRLSGRSLPEIGRALGGRDHTSIIHGSLAYPAKRAAQGRTLRVIRRGGNHPGKDITP